VLTGGLVLPGCGGGGGDQTPRGSAQPSSTAQSTGPVPAQPPQPPRNMPPPSRARAADPAATRVINAWSTALRHGHVDAAARYFALPSLVQNGSPPVRVVTRADARLFNASLPCGAVVRRAVAIGRFTVVVFRLTDRPGGDCAQGIGHAAGTAFVIKHGKITEWRRVDASTVPPAGVVPPTGRRPPEAPVLPPGRHPHQQPAPTGTGPVI
jgi:hypothetical protein